MAMLGRAVAIGASVAMHVALLGGAYLLGRSAVHRAFKPAPEGSVEIGVVYTAPPAKPLPGPLGAAPPRPAAPRRAVAPPRSEVPAELSAAPSTPSVQAAAPAIADQAGEAPVAAAGQGGEEKGRPGAVGSPGPGGTEGGVGPGSGAGSAEADEGEALAEIARRLAASARRCYPRAGQRVHAQGVATVRFCVGEGGAPREVQLVESSGVTLLDEAALGCVVSRAAPLPKTRRCVEVPVRFRVP
jgi:TonB family protein